MLDINFATRELTAYEAHLMRQATAQLDPASEMDFILRRAEELNDDDCDALARMLINRPFSEVRRLFNAAVEVAMPATMEALRRVDSEFEERRAGQTSAPARADEDEEEMFSDDLIC